MALVAPTRPAVRQAFSTAAIRYGSQIVARRSFYYHAFRYWRCGTSPLARRAQKVYDSHTEKQGNAISGQVGFRNRSFWRGRGSDPNSLSTWDRRHRSFWHRPGCQWVHNDGDPRRAPRDKGCPACQEEEASHQELAPRELYWQRKLHFMRDFLENEPYTALFGRSNERLRGIWPTNIHRLQRFIDEDWLRAVKLHHGSFTRGQDTDYVQSQAAPAESKKSETRVNQQKFDRTTPHRPVEPSTAARQNRFKPGTDTQSQGPIYREEVERVIISEQNVPGETKPMVQGYGNWRVSGNDGGSTYEASGELEYDPISNRMVPKPSSFSRDEQKSAGLAIEKVKETAIEVTSTEPPAAVTASESPRIASEEIAGISSEKTHAEASKLALKHAHALLRETTESLEQAREELRLFRTSKTSTQDQRHALDATDNPKQHNPKEDIQAKRELEQSWLKEAALERRRKAQSTTIAKHKNESPRFLAKYPVQFKGPILYGKDKPLKYMNAHELGLHRSALIKAWRKRQERPQETAASSLLREEVQNLQAAMNAYENKLHSTSRPEGTPITSPLNASETQAPVDNGRGEGDLCVNVVKYANTDRWFKKLAPHALTAERYRLEDRALVRSIREIYESVYGTIDTKHRQGRGRAATEDMTGTTATTSGMSIRSPTVVSHGKDDPTANVSKSRSKADPFLYQILAYDPTDKSVHTAIASASYTPPTGKKIISISDALIRLHAPAKFLPYLTKYQEEGYEIVSSNKNLLVLKREQPLPATAHLPSEGFSAGQSSEGNEASALLSDTSNTKPSMKINPIDGTGYDNISHKYPKPQTGNFASPTGFVNHDVPDYATQITPSAHIESSSTTAESASQAQSSGPSSSRQGPIVKRAEPVFSGQMKGSSYLSSSKSSLPSHLASDGARHGAASAAAAEQPSTYKATSSPLSSSGGSQPPNKPPLPPPSSGSEAGCGRFSSRYAPWRGYPAFGGRRYGRRFRRVRHGFRRALTVGLFTALCCYITGVIVESFRDKKTRRQQQYQSRSVDSSSSQKLSNFQRADEDGKSWMDDERKFSAAKAFLAGLVLLPLLKKLFGGRR